MIPNNQWWFNSGGVSSPIYDSDALLYFNQVVTNGGAPFTPAWKAKLNTWFVTAKANGYFSDLDKLLSLFNEHEIGARTSLVNPSQPMATFSSGSPQFTTFYGVTTAGNPDVINTQWNPRSDGVNFTSSDAFLGCGIQNNIPSPGMDTGATDNTNYDQIYSAYGDGNSYWNLNDGSGGTVANASLFDADYIITRSAGNRTAYKNNVSTSINTATTNTPNTNVYIGCLSQNGSSNTFKAATYTWWAVGKSTINVAQFRTDLTS